MKLAEKACRLSRRRNLPYLDTLVAAYSAAGNFDAAIAVCDEAIETATAARLSAAAEQSAARRPSNGHDGRLTGQCDPIQLDRPVSGQRASSARLPTHGLPTHGVA